ncbi:MAG TPA: LysE family translocator [Steroidobacteraceae bacterium]|nr:LysE family translocator [Steroidobacteraceae bacterium]
MISLHAWLAFVGASLLIGLIPGPGVISIVGYAINSGRNTALAAVAGMVVGNTIAMSLSLIGVGTVLAASPIAFNVIKWTGAIYLIGLGIVTVWRSREVVHTDQSNQVISPKAAFLNNILVGTFHPKTIVFFVAFVPQFMSTDGNYWIQSALLLVTFIATVACSDAAYGLLASRAAHLLGSKSGVFWSRIAGGLFMIAAGVLSAGSKLQG